jgi:hypothetical protein
MIGIYAAQYLLGTLLKYPDLYTVMNVELSTVSLLGFLAYFNYKQLMGANLDIEKKKQ